MAGGDVSRHTPPGVWSLRGQERCQRAMDAPISLQGCLGISVASPGASGQGRSLSTRGRQAISRRVDRGEWDEREQGRHTVQQRFDGAGTREVKENTVLVLFN